MLKNSQMHWVIIFNSLDEQVDGIFIQRRFAQDSARLFLIHFYFVWSVYNSVSSQNFSCNVQVDIY